MRRHVLDLQKKKALITLNEEEQGFSMKKKGILDDSQPQQLLDTLEYLFGIHFAFRKRLQAENSQIL